MKKLLSILMAAVLALSLCGYAAADEVETIEVAYMLTMNAAEERDAVEQAINDLLDAKGLGVRVHLVCIDFASWGTQINLMLTDGSIDLFNACFMPSLAVLVDNGSVSPITDLLETEGQGILECLGEYIECARIDGEIYGAPKVDAFSSAQLFFMDKAMADQCGIDPEAITDLASLTEALKVVKAANPDMTMIANGNGGSYMVISGVDFLGTEDPLGCLMLEDSENPLTVFNYYETEEFRSLLGYAREWSELGFFMKDPINAQDGAFAYLSNGQAFGTFGTYCSEEVGKSVQEKGNGRELYVAQLVPNAWATTGNVTGMTWCVPMLS